MTGLPVIPPEVIQRAWEGALDAVHGIVVQLQTGLFNLAVSATTACADRALWSWQAIMLAREQAGVGR